MAVNYKSDRRNQIIDEAAEWFVLMQQESPREEDVREFADWLASSAEHVREYLQVSVLSNAFEKLHTSDSTTALIEAGLHADDRNVIPISASGSGKRGSGVTGRLRFTWRQPAVLLAQVTFAISIMAAALVTPWSSSAPKVYETGVGEQVSLPLQDGTVMTLNTKSRVELDFSETYRDVLLTNGEALFDVVKDSNRPFRVLTGKATISAIGTSFNVHHRKDSTVVTVVEGSIEIVTRFAGGAAADGKAAATGSDGEKSRPVLVTIGQQARVEGNSGRVAILETDVAEVTAWRQRRLVFDRKPLAAVVEEFNLYNDARIIIGDPRLNSIEIGGAFSANERRSFALFLEETGLAGVQIGDDDTITLVSPGSSD